MIEIVGYTPKWSFAPGEEVPVKVSCDGEYEAEIVRLVCGDTHPEGPGVKEEPIEAEVNGEYVGEEQEIHDGSYIRVLHDDELALSGSFSLFAFVCPTTPGAGRQGILTKWTDGNGYGLFVNEEGELEFSVGNGTDVVSVASGAEFDGGSWYFVGASIDSDGGSLGIWQEAIPPEGDEVFVEADCSLEPGSPECPLLLAAAATRADGEFVAENCYNGKLDRPRLSGERLTPDEAEAIAEGVGVPEHTIAAWDFSDGFTSEGIARYDHVTDVGPNDHHGEAVNLPTRGVTGYNWDGRRHVYHEAPEQFAAIHFHEDDLGDAEWDTDISWTVPSDVESGVYAARLRTDGDETYVPFFVRPGPDAERADVLFLAPTASYLAYANDHNITDSPMAELVIGQTPIMQPYNVFLSGHREFGLSCYDAHADGHGVYFSSRRRPILNMQPKVKHFIGSLPSQLWQFNADLHLVDWLEEQGYDYDVVTDHDLHREGQRLLDPYNVVLTGTHPEYYTEEMWDALSGYQTDGGRMMYMGGNGFYWVTGFHPAEPDIIEVRKGETGTRQTETPPGEYRLGFTGTKGGLWRHRGKPPQELAGVGFTGQGFDESSYYQRLSDSYEPATEFIFDGVEGEVIGDFGLLGGGAAGLELDKSDEELGTPSDAYLLATSKEHSDNMVLVPEEILMTPPGRLSATDTPGVRADMVYYQTRNGGAVFSTGSIAWCGSLAHDAYDNDVSRITENVLSAFASGDPLPE